MRLMASSQPSGVARSHEMRSMLPCWSLVWQPPHLAITSALVTGIPSSGAGLADSADVAACGFWLCASRGNTRIDASSTLISLSGYDTPSFRATKQAVSEKFFIRAMAFGWSARAPGLWYQQRNHAGTRDSAGWLPPRAAVRGAVPRTPGDGAAGRHRGYRLWAAAALHFKTAHRRRTAETQPPHAAGGERDDVRRHRRGVRAEYSV